MTKNIVLFGQTGAGKSSVVNLMAGKIVAKTSPDMHRCTLHWEKHDIDFDGHGYSVFDTIGLEEPQLGAKEYHEIIVSAYNLIAELRKQGGIDLLMFCVRAGRVTASLQTNYRLFFEFLCEKKVPIVLVLTGLERERDMEDWWTRNGHTFQQYSINVVDHVCITAAAELDGRHRELYEKSRPLVRNLVARHTYESQGSPYTEGEAWYRRIMQKLWELTLGNFKFNPKRTDIEYVLTQRCGMPLEVAKELASEIRSDLGRKSPSLTPARPGHSMTDKQRSSFLRS